MGESQNQKVFIGIDMDSEKFDCYTNQGSKNWKTFSVSKKGLESFTNWTKTMNQPVISLEGFHGQNAALESWLEKEKITFYSIPPFNVSRFRESSISRNKNNKNDARAVAEFSFSQFLLKGLDQFKSSYSPNQEIRVLTRRYFQANKIITSEISSLWKVLRTACPDIYLYLKGKHPDWPTGHNLLNTKGFLKLLCSKPNPKAWRSLPDADILKLIGTRHFSNRLDVIDEIKTVASIEKELSKSEVIIISQIARNLYLQKECKQEIKKSLTDYANNNAQIQKLMKISGFGIITSSMIVGEIVDIRRFKSNDNLASYSGFGLKENKTGTKKAMVNNTSFNRYLKHAIMTAGIQYIKNNPESMLNKKYTERRNQGHSTFYCRRIIARAIIRRIYKILKEV